MTKKKNRESAPQTQSESLMAKSLLAGSRVAKWGSGRRAWALSIATLVALVLFGYSLRTGTFQLTHYAGDQCHYAALAFKLEKYGIEGYNLRGVNFGYVSREKVPLAFLTETESRSYINLIQDLTSRQMGYYDEPLHHIPFGFPLALMLAHKIDGAEDYHLLVPTREMRQLANTERGYRDLRFPPEIAEAQTYLVIIPLISSLLVGILTFLLAQVLYRSHVVALTAAFLMLICPVALLTSHKVWADDMTTALTVAAVLFYALGRDRQKFWYFAVGGVMCGLATMTKQSGAFIIFALVSHHFLFEILMKREVFADRSRIVKTIFDTGLLLFGAGFLLGTGYWFYKITSVYGSPIYSPVDASHQSPWLNKLMARPWYLYFAGIPWLTPPFLLAYAAPAWLWIQKEHRRSTVLLLLWAATFYVIFHTYLTGKEHRYMLPCYPALAILAGYVANDLRVRMDRHVGHMAGTVGLLALLIGAATWCVPIAHRAIYHGKGLLEEPF